MIDQDVLAELPLDVRRRVACEMVADAALRASMIMGPGDADGREFAAMAALLGPPPMLRGLAPGTPPESGRYHQPPLLRLVTSDIPADPKASPS